MKTLDQERGKPEAQSKGIVFVSYSRIDQGKVVEIVDELERHGVHIWIDTKRKVDSQRFAAPIVEAIRTSSACAFMCSSTAYRSDHVVRELYLADKYGKPMIPILIEQTCPSTDFEYFFSGLDLISGHPIKDCVSVIVNKIEHICRRQLKSN